VAVRVGVDIGGTFTDLVVYDENTHAVRRTKHPTTPDAPENGFLAAYRQAELERAHISLFMHATTQVTNLVITRTGSRVGLITTRGFRDVLEIGRSYRDQLYDPQWDKPRHLVPRHLVREVTERVDHGGRVVVPLVEAEVQSVVRELVAAGVEVIAVSLFNAYANGAHERAIAEIVATLAPATPVSLASEVDPRIREYERASTTVLNAYAIPRVQRYVDRLAESLGRPLYYMHSGGGVMRAADARKFPVSLMESGPAAGVLAAQLIGRLIGLQNLITADVGGTSFDVCVIREGEPDTKDHVDVEWGIPARIQSIDVRSIGAGGGSIIWIDEGGVLRVGPRSAGAAPGPACYNSGGVEPTITDANIVMGILDPTRFLGGRLKIDPDRARKSLEGVAAHFDVAVEEAALGAYRIVNANMAQAILEATVRKGIDPREFSLLAFGGGGGQHAVEVAREAGVSRVVVPPNPSAFSAFGLLTADLKRTTARTVMLPLDEAALGRLRDEFIALERAGRALLEGEDRLIRRIGTSYILDVRYVGQSNEVAVQVDSRRPASAAEIYGRFCDTHARLYGTSMADPAEIVNIRVTVTGHLVPIQQSLLGPARRHRPAPQRSRRTAFSRSPVAVFDRDSLTPGAIIDRPCIVEEVDATHIIPEQCVTTVDRYGNLIIRILGGPRRRSRRTAA
jgi:N-methylhydantoinase A